MDYQLQYLHYSSEVRTVCVTEELDNPTDVELGIWVRDHQTANPCPPECSSWLFTEEDDEFISGGL